MPLLKFECKKCHHVYEELLIKTYDDSREPKEQAKSLKCPKCKSKSKKELPGLVSFAFANPEGTDRWNSDSCGHDYRYKHKAPSVAKERETAQKLSHVGPNPYNEIDDISSGKYFGEVK